jgi:aspartate aminotransferase-like enzyme
MNKYRLFAPGPTPVSEETSLAMARPIIHHRTETFEKVVSEVREGLKWLFQTKNEVLILASSGTGAMEGAVVNTMNRGDKVVVVDGGKFGERWWKICKSYGVEADVIKVEWGRAVDVKEIKARLDKGGYRAVFVQASESSTGTYHPIKEIADLVKAKDDCLFVVDAISALGAMNLPMDAWGIDILITGSQKALGLPPGLAMVGLSDKAWKFTETATLPKFYFDLKRELKNIQQNTTAFTPAISLIIGLAQVLREFKKEGLENLFARHARLAEATRQAMKALGLKLYSNSPVNSLTAVCTPEGPNRMDAQKVFKILQTKYNMTIAGGQDAAKGKIFRIAHLGYYDDLDVVTVVAAVEWALAELGHKFTMGAGVGAAMKVLCQRS